MVVCYVFAYQAFGRKVQALIASAGGFLHHGGDAGHVQHFEYFMRTMIFIAA